MNIMTDRKQQLSDMLLFLADFYKPPTAELYHSMKTRASRKLLKGFFQALDDTSFSNAFQSFEHMKQSYFECFIGPGEPFAPPIESLYKQWTEDSTAGIPFAKQKGYFFGDPALHALYLYRQFQLELPDEYQAMPDHLTLLLEFLALLAEYGSTHQVKVFIEDHFDWLDDFILELKKSDRNGFYIMVTQLVNQLVHSYQFVSLIEQEHADIERSE